MHYYQKNLGDYSAAAGHLTALEHGIYNLLLDWYYANESPIPHERAYRIARANPEETQLVLTEFFQKDGEEWRHRRCDAEIAAYHDRKDRAVENGKRGGRPPKSLNGNDTKTQPFSTETQPLANPNQSLTEVKANQEPVTINQPKAKNLSGSSPANACPHQDIIALYHELLPSSPRVKVWDGSRSANLRARWREDAKRQSLDYWRRMFVHIGKSEFLTGRTHDKDRQPFFASLDWIVMPKNFAKIIEGRYHAR